MKSFVLDVNIYISAAIGRRFEEIFRIVAEHSLQVFANEDLYDELLSVLNYPRIFKKLPAPAESFLELVKDLTLTGSQRVAFSGLPDAKDDYLFGLCLAARATLVTKDKLLLNWNESPVPLISWAQFKRTFPI